MNGFKRVPLPAYVSAGVILLVLASGSSPAWSLELGCVPATEAEIANLFVRWNDALQKPQPDHPTPDAVVKLYATDGVLLPTVENGPYIGHADIRKYFEHFLEKKPSGAIDGRHNIHIGCNVAFDAGLYTFTFRKEGEKPAAARYTYVYKYYDDGGWLIAHHHSSVQPPERK